MKLSLPRVALALFAGTLSLSAHAAGSGTFGIGARGGIALPDTSSSALTLGLDATYKLSPMLGLTGFLYKYGVSVDTASGSNTVSASTSHVHYGIQGDYFFPGSFFRIGARTGLVNTSVTAKSASSGSATSSVTIDDSHSNFFIGAQLGYDYPIGTFALGGELSYTLGMGDNAPTALGIVAVLKFWF